MLSDELLKWVGRIGAYISKLVGEGEGRKRFLQEKQIVFLGKTNGNLREKEIQKLVMFVYTGKSGLSSSFKAIKLP